MANIEELRSIVSELMQVPSESIAGSTALNGILATSLGRARLDAVMRSRLNISNPGVYTLKTFDELCQLSGITTPNGNGTVAVQSRSVQTPAGLGPEGNGIAIGIDLQSVDALPKENDYWEGEFYRQHFTRQEIAYALLQPEPRESFASAWCAKEALRKADKRWLDVGWQLTEIVHDANGKPTLRSGESAIPCSLSMSHTNGFAIAVVVTERAQTQPTAQTVAPTAVVKRSEPPPGSRLPLLLAGLALLLSLATAGFEFLR